MKPLNQVVARLAVVCLALILLVAAVVVLGRKGSSRPQSAPTGRLPGVDVSSHNGDISWSEAARLGLSFVFARATEGKNRVDSKYTSFREGARASGLDFTAYHFARPDRTESDAKKEADHFLNVAALGPGDLAPVLDIEVSGGLGVAALQSWVRAWLEEVVAVLGVQPVIYTSPNFWTTYMGDTTAFAEEGYMLDIASWAATVSPVVPAQNWGGRGWTLWQTSTCGHLPGIPRCIDTEVFDGADLGELTIP
jgi:lysozyme